MLPPEILDRICSLLDCKDVVSFSQVVQLFDTTFKHVLLKKCPYFDPKYCQETTWKSRLLKYVNTDTRKFPKNLKCEVFTDKPLPDDFHCLCKSDQHTIVYTNKGIFVGDKFLSLTDPKGTETRPATVLLEEVYTEMKLFCEEPPEIKDLLRQKRTNELTTAVFYHSLKTELVVKYSDAFKIIPFPKHVSFRLQVVGSNVLFTHDYDQWSDTTVVSQDFSSSVDRHSDLNEIPSGTLLYDGHVFDVCVGDNDVEVKSTLSSNYSDLLYSECYNVEQDLTYTQYGVIYDELGFVSALIDLRDHKILCWSNKQYFRMVGVSEGSVGVWQYSSEYLQSHYEFSKEIALIFPSNNLSASFSNMTISERNVNRCYFGYNDYDEHDAGDYYYVDDYDYYVAEDDTGYDHYGED